MSPLFRKWLWATLALGGLIVLVIVILLIMVAATKSTQVRTTQQTTVGKIDASTETLHLIRDCVTPGGECYRRGEQRTAKAVGDIQTAQTIAAVAATSCAAEKPHQTFSQVYQCTVRRVEAANRHRR